MKISAKMRKDLRAQARSQASLERQIDKAIEKTVEEYREWCSLQFLEGYKPLTIIAEGDSWFNYSIAGNDVIDKLESILDTKINNLAAPGDEAREMLTGKQKERLERELKRGPANKKRKKYDIFLFSGGGNDLVGKKTFYKWFHDYKKGMQPEDILNKKALKSAFNMLELSYNELINIRNTYSPDTHLLLNAYDFAIPDGRGVCFKGPWLKPGLKQRNVPSKMRWEVVKLFLKDYEKFLSLLAKNNTLVTVIPTQGTLVKKDWANELHPTDPGFKKIAEIVKSTIQSLN